MKIFAPRSRDFSSEGMSEISQLRSGWFLAKRFFQVLKGRWKFSTVLSGRNFLRAVFQPLRSWLISGCRSATQFAVAAMILFAAFGARAETTNDLSDAEIQGRRLAKQLYDMRPTENFTNTGVLKIHEANGTNTDLPVRFETVVTETNWQTIYTAIFSDTANLKLLDTTKIIHVGGQQNQYEETHFFDYMHAVIPGRGGIHGPRGQGKSVLPGEQTMIPFANSDFWIADLGLEFFHWPEQKILKKENRRSRACNVLQSTNPSTNGYSRVVSWVDEESGGIVHAEAYDANGKLLKVFDPKSFKKVNGQWELQDMEIRNVQTGSRSRIEFDLNSK
jgi:hypothetical protein